MRGRPSIPRHRTATLCLILIGLQAPCQLNKWLMRSGSGEVLTLDLSGPSPTAGPVIPLFGAGGNEDVNLMTDAAGGILFSSAVGNSDLIEVRNANMVTMPHGHDLIGDRSSQASAVVSRPCSPQQYFLIHHNAATHMSYSSVVDMALAGGLGDVAEKNVLIGENMGEGMAVSHRLESGCRWLFCFSIDGTSYILKRALVSASGIGEPQAIDTISGTDLADWSSCLKLSPGNDRLALSLPNAGPVGSSDVALWDLDLESGTVGPAELLSLSEDPIIGIEFSPLGGFLYFAGNSILAPQDFGRVQLSTHLVEVIDDDIGSWTLSIECAANGSLYVGTSGIPQTLAEVRFPDATPLASIGYDHDALVFALIGIQSVLPNTIEGEPPGDTSTPPYVDFQVQELPNCGGHLFTSQACLATWQQWDFGDGWTDLREKPVHHYPAGTFDVTLTVVSCGQTYSLTRPALITVEGIQPEAAFATSDSVCQHSPLLFENGSQSASAYHWWFGDGSSSSAQHPEHTYAQPGTFTTILVAQEGCITDTARAQTAVLPAALPSFETPSDPCDEDTRFVNTSEGGEDWYWEFGDGDSTTVRDPIHVYASMGAFDVSLVSDRGTMCEHTVSRTLYAGYGLIPVAWYAPNAFSPNGDGTNDVLSIRGPEMCASPVMTIHNKWGQQLWEGDSTTGWDGMAGGQPAPEGVYVYVLKGRLDDMKHGWFVLLR